MAKNLIVVSFIPGPDQDLQGPYGRVLIKSFLWSNLERSNNEEMAFFILESPESGEGPQLQATELTQNG